MKQRMGQFLGYTIRELLDSPPHYEWYLATDDSPAKQWVVIETLSRELCNAAELKLCYQDACRAEAHVRIDGLIPIREIGTDHEHGVFVVYPYAFGQMRLGELCEAFHEARRALLPGLCVSVLLDAARILGEAYAHGLKHFALLPHHIIVSSMGDVYVQGFAEAAMRRRFFFDTELSEKFDSPEMRRREAVGVASDVYAIGALLYQGLTSEFQPDEWEPRWMGMMDVFNKADVPGESLSSVLDFFQHTLAERPSQRYGGYGALIHALEHLSVELGGYMPREVRAQTLDGLFDDYPPVPANDRSDVISLVTGDFPSISPDRSAENSPVDFQRLPEGGRHVSGGAGASASAGDISFEDTLTSPSFDVPETRILHRSSASYRTINPALRVNITLSPLEILAHSRYQILDQLGVGGTGTVYKVLDTTLTEILALKVLKPELVADSSWLQRFKRELKVTRDLEHPNILQAYHLEQLEGLYFFTMRYIDGKNLSELIHERGLPVIMSLNILAQVAMALIAAHSHHVIHRDLKPANIMVEKGSYHPYLMDFGIASAPDVQSLTMAGLGIGTPYYMAPEQSRGEEATVQADIYSFGVLCYEVFTQQLPFNGATPIAIYTAQMSGIFRPVREINPNVPKQVADMVESCMNPKASERPASMDIVLKAFCS